MSYLALYRRYRPNNFNDVIGQEKIIKTLINQINSDKISHAYLFCGSRGTGKTSTAKIFAKAINCRNPQNGSPCYECEVCKKQEQSNLDIFEIDAASNNGVDEIRDLREKVKYPPMNGKYKVYIIDEVHMLSPGAFNALLKTLEEPPKHVVFVLATTEVHKLPATILSRCIRFDFSLVGVKELSELLVKILKDNSIEYETEAINLIARAGEGSVRDMLSIADMCISYGGNKISYEDVLKVLGVTKKSEIISIAESIFANDLGQAIIKLNKILETGKSPLLLSKDMIEYFRDLLVICTAKTTARNFVVVQDDVFEKMKAQAVSENYFKIIKAIEEFSKIEQELRYSVLPKLVLEVALIKTMDELSLSERVEKLEKTNKGV